MLTGPRDRLEPHHPAALALVYVRDEGQSELHLWCSLWSRWWCNSNPPKALTYQGFEQTKQTVWCGVPTGIPPKPQEMAAQPRMSLSVICLNQDSQRGAAAH